MTRVEEAIELYKSGLSCCQSVLVVFSEEFGLSRPLALKISQGFGGGIARMAETCGVVTGALMVIGLKYGKNEVEDKGAAKKTSEVFQTFLKTFQINHVSIKCKDLLGFTEEPEVNWKLAKEKELFKTICHDLVREAVHILEEIL